MYITREMLKEMQEMGLLVDLEEAAKDQNKGKRKRDTFAKRSYWSSLSNRMIGS
jgi:hypothetical protein